MIRIIMSGCNGKMGQVITSLAEQDGSYKIVAGFDIVKTEKNNYPVFSDPGKCDIEADVIIDFSHPDALGKVLKFALAKKIPAIIATTGLSKNDEDAIIKASKDIAIFRSANMSLGVNLLHDLVKKASMILEGGFDIEIIEKHHNLKIDAPSGTALAIADSINSVLKEKQQYIFDRHSRRKKRSRNEIGIHTVRGGSIVGEHSVIFAGNDEIIEINHIALSKDIFASGALKAAEFMYGKKSGLYNMADLIAK